MIYSHQDFKMLHLLQQYALNFDNWNIQFGPCRLFFTPGVTSLFFPGLECEPRALCVLASALSVSSLLLCIQG